MSLTHTVLPNTDLAVSPLCMGAPGFGTTIIGDAADRLTAAFVEAGGNFFDTAHVYQFWEPNGLGANERELAASLRRIGCTDECIIATKGGHPAMSPGYERPADFLSERVLVSDIEESLDRLQRDRIDLYFLHRDDGRTPVGEILGILNREIDRGRLRYLGTSNWSVQRLEAANAWAAAHGKQGFVASQIQGSLAEPTWKPTEDPTTRRLGAEEIAWHAASGVPVVTYSATAGGYFAGRGHNSGLYATADNRARYARATTLAARKGCTAAQIGLAYLLHLPARVIPLFGTTHLEHLAEIVAATAVSLSPEEVVWLREGGADPVPGSGAPSPAQAGH